MNNNNKSSKAHSLESWKEFFFILLIDKGGSWEMNDGKKYRTLKKKWGIWFGEKGKGKEGFYVTEWMIFLSLVLSLWICHLLFINHNNILIHIHVIAWNTHSHIDISISISILFFFHQKYFFYNFYFSCIKLNYNELTQRLTSCSVGGVW